MPYNDSSTEKHLRQEELSAQKETKLKKYHMPHFVIHCSESIIELVSPEEIMQEVYSSAESTGLFAPGDIKVRIDPFMYYTVGNSKEDFIHVFANIMEGRKTSLKSDLSRTIIAKLKMVFPEVPIISINIRAF